MKIGITERGDASADLSWENKLSDVDGAILITKNITGEFIDKVLSHKDKLIVHATCTGYGATALEPNVLPWALQLNNAKALVRKGFDINKIVIRVDPIIPSRKGLALAGRVIATASEAFGFKRFRISLIDMYPHVIRRFTDAGIRVPFNSFSSPDIMAENANRMFGKLKEKYPDITIECCAEKGLSNVLHSGCIGTKELELLGLPVPDEIRMGVQRKGCLCIANIKTELLDNKCRCPNGCLYCYWKDAE